MKRWSSVSLMGGLLRQPAGRSTVGAPNERKGLGREAATFSCGRAFLWNRIDAPWCLQKQEVTALLLLNARVSLSLRVLNSHNAPRAAVLALWY